MVRKVLCLLLIAALLLISGCGLMDWIFPEKTPEPPGENEPQGEGEPETSSDKLRTSVLYVADTHGKYILPLSYDIPWEEGIAKAVLKHLVEGGPAHQYLTTRGLKAVLPAQTTILGMTVKDGLATIDFSPEFLQTADAVHESLILDALTYTLTEFDSIDGITIWVNGQALTKLNYGTPVAPVLTRERGINTRVSAKGTGAAVTIYLGLDSLAGGRFFVPVTRPVAAVTELSAAALEQLIGGPADAEDGLKAVLPATTRVLQMLFEGETAVVDFSADLAAADTIETAIAAIVLTLTELPNIRRVKLSMDGKTIVLPDGRSLVEPVTRPLSANPLAF